MSLQSKKTRHNRLILNICTTLLLGLCSCSLLACQNMSSSGEIKVTKSTIKLSAGNAPVLLQQVAQIGSFTTPQDAKVHPETYHFFQEIMGTQFQIQVIAFDKQTALSTARASFNEARRIEHLMSSWRKQSEIGQINQHAGSRFVTISYETAWLLCKAKQMSALTRGSFDVTWASLKGLWDFKSHKVPKHKVLLRRLKAVGSKFIEINIRDRNDAVQSCQAIKSLMPHPIWTRFEDHPHQHWQWNYQARLVDPQNQIDLGGIRTNS